MRLQFSQRMALCAALTVLSVAYTYLATWGLDEGFRSIGAKWRNLHWHLSCGAVFALPVLAALPLQFPRDIDKAFAILALCAISNPLVTFGPGLFMPFIPPLWVTGLVTSAALSLLIALLVLRWLPPWRQLLLAGGAGTLGGWFFILARQHMHYKGCDNGGVCVPVEWVLPGYFIWQAGFVASLFLYPSSTTPDADKEEFRDQSKR